MNTLVTRFTLLAVGILSIVTVALAGVSPVSAAPALVPDPSVIALEIVPVCSDATSGLATWNVTNKNSVDVQIDWNNTLNGLTGTFAAIPGASVLYTGYVGTDPNNTTQFIWAGNVTQTNAKAESCQPVVVTPPVTPCVDGSIQQNLVVTWLAKDKVNIHTINNAPLCNDVHIYFSSYIMPDNYDGTGFYGNPTAYPQTLFSSADAVLTKDTDGNVDLTINLPDSCKNVQVDVYYAPEITAVGPNGHGTQNILSNIYMSTACPVVVTPPVTPGMGGGTPTPPVEPPVVAPTPVTPEVALPAVLPETGASFNFMPVAILSVLTYAGMYIRQRRIAAKAEL
jgi:hypothetical protein